MWREGRFGSPDKEDTELPGPVLISEAVALAAAAFWCVENPVFPGASLKLFAMS